MYTINVNCATGEVTRHEMTPEEVAEWEAQSEASQLIESKQEGIAALEDFRQKAEIQRIAKAAVGMPVIPSDAEFDSILLNGVQQIEAATSKAQVESIVEATEQAAEGE